MSHPLHLSFGASGDETDGVVVSPESAGWTYAGLRVVSLSAGGERSFQTGPDEMVVLPLAGSVTAKRLPDAAAIHCPSMKLSLRISALKG